MLNPRHLGSGLRLGLGLYLFGGGCVCVDIFLKKIFFEEGCVCVDIFLKNIF